MITNEQGLSNVIDFYYTRQNSYMIHAKNFCCFLTIFVVILLSFIKNSIFSLRVVHIWYKNLIFNFYFSFFIYSKYLKVLRFLAQ